MRKILASVIGAFVLSVIAAGQVTEKKWVEHKSAEGRFSVLLPTEPKISKQPTADASGNPLESYSATSTEAGATMIVSYFDYVGTYSFDKGRDGIIEKTGGKLVSEANIKLDLIPGRSVVVDASADGFDFRVWARYYDAGTRIYLLQFLIQKADDTPENTNRRARYFDSFKLLPKA